MTMTGNEWMGAVTGGIDAARLQELDPDVARTLLELDEAAADLLLQIGAVDVTDADRAAHAKKMRRLLAELTADLTDWIEECARS